jgi:hypothetical protein
MSVSKRSSSTKKRSAATAKPVTTAKALQKQQKQQEEYARVMMPSYLLRQTKDRELLTMLFKAFQGTNKHHWRILDPKYKLLFPESFYA